MPEYLRKIILLFAKDKGIHSYEAKPDLQDRQFAIKIEPI